MPGKQPYRYANQLLAQLVPSEVLRKARELALQYRREEFIRAYLLKRMWFVLPVILLSFFVCVGCFMGLTWLLAQYGIRHSILVPIVCFGGFLLLIYLLFSWLERQASRLAATSVGHEDDGPSKPS